MFNDSSLQNVVRYKKLITDIRVELDSKWDYKGTYNNIVLHVMEDFVLHV